MTNTHTNKHTRQLGAEIELVTRRMTGNEMNGYYFILSCLSGV